MSEQDSPKLRFPTNGRGRDVPRVQAEGGEVSSIARREGDDVRPINGGTPINNGITDAFAPSEFDRRIRDFGELVMAMGVVNEHPGEALTYRAVQRPQRRIGVRCPCPLGPPSPISVAG